VGEVLVLDRIPVTPAADAEYTSIGIRSFGRGLFHYDPQLGANLPKLRFFALEPNRLVVSNIKGWEGAIALSSEADRGCLASSRFLPYAARGSRIDLRWAYWFFLSEHGNRLIQMASPGSADRNRTLAIDRFEALEIGLPPIDEQRRTAARLDRLQERAASITDILAVNSPESILAMLPNLIDAILHRYSPVMTRVEALGDFIADRVSRGDDPSPARVFVGPNHIESHTGRRLGFDPLGDDTGPKLRFRPGDVVYLRLRPYLNKVWVADCNGLCSSDQIVLRPKPGLDSNLIAHGLRGLAVLSRATELTSSLQLPRIRQQQFAGIQVPTDGADTGGLVQILNDTRDRVVELANKRKQQMAGAKALVPSILNEAFGGRAKQSLPPMPDRP